MSNIIMFPARQKSALEIRADIVRQTVFIDIQFFAVDADEFDQQFTHYVSSYDGPVFAVDEMTDISFSIICAFR